MDVDPLRFFNMPILARLTLVEGAIHDITLTGVRQHSGRDEPRFQTASAAQVMSAHASKAALRALR
jgi:hypothetical protein